MRTPLSNLHVRWYFRNEGEKARQLALERPKYWEYRLTEHLLSEWLARWRSDFDTVEPVNHAGRVFTCETEFHYWAVAQSVKVADVLAGVVAPILCRELIAAWGAPGQAGDAVLIKRTFLKLDGVCREMLAWKHEVTSAQFPRTREKARQMMKGWEKQPLELVEDFGRQLSAMLANSKLSGEQKIGIKLGGLPNGDEFGEELARVTNALPESDSYATPEAVAQKGELDRLLDRFSKRQRAF